MIVLSPSTVQEAVDMTYEAFDLAERDNSPVLILTDGVLGTMMEPVELPPMKSPEEVAALKEARRSVSAVGHKPEEQVRFLPGGVGGSFEPTNMEAAKLYAKWDREDVRVEEYMIDDAEIILASYGISARICKVAVKKLREEGIKAGLIRAITVNPFPYKSYENLDFNRVKGILDVEMSIPAQMRWDVDHAVHGRCQINECLRSGGEIMTLGKVMDAARELAKEVL